MKYSYTVEYLYYENVETEVDGQVTLIRGTVLQPMNYEFQANKRLNEKEVRQEVLRAALEENEIVVQINNIKEEKLDNGK